MAPYPVYAGTAVTTVYVGFTVSNATTDGYYTVGAEPRTPAIDRLHPLSRSWQYAHHASLFTYRQPPRKLGAPRAGFAQVARRRAREPPGKRYTLEALRQVDHATRGPRSKRNPTLRAPALFSAVKQ